MLLFWWQKVRTKCHPEHFVQIWNEIFGILGHPLTQDSHCPCVVFCLKNNWIAGEGYLKLTTWFGLCNLNGALVKREKRNCTKFHLITSSCMKSVGEMKVGYVIRNVSTSGWLFKRDLYRQTLIWQTTWVNTFHAIRLRSQQLYQLFNRIRRSPCSQMTSSSSSPSSFFIWASEEKISWLLSQTKNSRMSLASFIFCSGYHKPGPCFHVSTLSNGIRAVDLSK